MHIYVDYHTPITYIDYQESPIKPHRLLSIRRHAALKPLPNAMAFLHRIQTKIYTAMTTLLLELMAMKNARLGMKNKLEIKRSNFPKLHRCQT